MRLGVHDVHRRADRGELAPRPSLCARSRSMRSDVEPTYSVPSEQERMYTKWEEVRGDIDAFPFLCVGALRLARDLVLAQDAIRHGRGGPIGPS